MKPIAWNAKLWKDSVEHLREFVNSLVTRLGRSERRVTTAPVLVDNVYGTHAEFRSGLRQLEIVFFLQVDGEMLKGLDHEVRIEVKRTRC